MTRSFLAFKRNISLLQTDEDETSPCVHASLFIRKPTEWT